jgi:hypothetical protein
MGFENLKIIKRLDLFLTFFVYFIHIDKKKASCYEFK